LRIIGALDLVIADHEEYVDSAQDDTGARASHETEHGSNLRFDCVMAQIDPIVGAATLPDLDRHDLLSGSIL
jgi:hypothetical protein